MDEDDFVLVQIGYVLRGRGGHVWVGADTLCPTLQAAVTDNFPMVLIEEETDG